MSAELPIQRGGMYDPQRWRRSVQKGRERGCWVYVPVAELQRTQLHPGEAPPFYRVAGRAGGRTVVIQFREAERMGQ